MLAKVVSFSVTRVPSGLNLILDWIVSITQDSITPFASTVTAAMLMLDCAVPLSPSSAATLLPAEVLMETPSLSSFSPTEASGAVASEEEDSGVEVDGGHFWETG